MQVRLRKLLLGLLIGGIVITVGRVVLDLTGFGVAAAVFYLVVPGALLLANFTAMKDVEVAVACVLSVALSVAFLIFGSLLCNEVLPLFGFRHPLATGPVTVGVNCLLILLIGVTYWRHGDAVVDLARFRIRLRRTERVLAGVCAMLPVQAIAGAVVLNNGGSSTVAVATVIEAVVVISVVFAFRRRLNCAVMYPLALFCVSCAVLLMVAVRSNYVLGWDINQELYVLQLTQSHGRWVYSGFNDPYNSCLSITTFPAALSSLTGISAVWLLKVVYPIVFSVSAIALYRLFGEYCSRAWAYLGVLLVIAQPQYLNEMPMLGRQEIAFLFVAAAYLLLLTQGRSNGVGDKALFLLLTVSLVVSHYATTYLFVLSLCVVYIWRKVKAHRIGRRVALSETKKASRSFLTLRLLLACLSVTVLWSVQFSALSVNVSYFANQVYKNVGHLFTSDVRSVAVTSALLGLHGQNSALLLREDVQRVSKEAGADLAPQYVPSVKAPPSARGALRGALSSLNYAYPAVSTFLKICLVVGLVLLLKSPRRDDRFLLFQGSALAYAGGIVAFLVLPYASLGYNFERFVLQALFLLTLPILRGLAYFAKLFRRRARSSMVIALAIIIVYGTFTWGLAAEVLGGSAAVQFGNYGLQYSRFYTDASEVAAMAWLGRTDTSRTSIYADMYAATRLLPYAGISAAQITEDMVPPFSRNSYVFASHCNSVEGLTFVDVMNREISMTYPTTYLTDSRNNVYTNGSAAVYR